MKRYISLFSQLYHLAVYSIEKPKIQFEKGIFIISIDVDVGNRQLGVINRGKNDVNVGRHTSEYRVGEIEELAFPLFLETFNDFEVPVTFATRGQLTEANDSILELLLKSSVKHDIGAHGYYHREFTSLSRNEAESELRMISAGMKKFGIVPRSFVFPRNRVAHLNLLEKYGYECYRSYGNLTSDCMYIEKRGLLYDVHPSLYLCQGARLIFLKKILDIAISKRLPLHLWCHLWNFGEKTDFKYGIINKVLSPFLKYAVEKVKEDMLSFETMLSASLKVESSLKNDVSSS